MRKHLSGRSSSGYTIIEIIISIFIVVILFTAVQAGYRQFVLRKSLETLKSHMMSDIKLAQQYAMTGKKPAGCNGLNGYIFSVSATNNNYLITADCDTDVMVKTVSLPDIAKGISIGADVSVLFKVLGMGTDIDVGSGGTRTITLVQQTTGFTETVVVSAGGEIR